MPAYTLKQIAEMTAGKLIGDPTVIIRNIATDSRNLLSPNDSVFFAIKGERHDGHQFIPDLFNKKKLHHFVVEEIPENVTDLQGINIIQVPNTLMALQNLATEHRKTYFGPVLAITGSNGKTIIKEWLYQLLHFDKNIIRSPKSYNSQIGVPLSVWNIEPKADLAIIEAGISRHDEMQKLHAIINPEIGLFTNIGEPHQENFYSIQRKVREKLVLFRDVKTLIYCADHDFIAEEMDDWINPGQKILTWSVKENATLKISSINKNNKSTAISGTYNNTVIDITIPFTDDASVENAIHCWLFLLQLGYNNLIIKQRMLNLTPVAMRLELKKGINNCTLINDSYNSDIHSLSIAIDFLNQQHQHSKKTLILSDILQTGKDEDELYQSVSKLIDNKDINRLVGIGPAIFNNASVFNCEKEFFQSTESFLQHVKTSGFQNEAILLKGARHFEFERVSAILEQKAHRTVLEINLTAMVHNLNYFRSKLKSETKIMVMVKAFSYGSGTYEIANMLEYQKVDYLAVAIADEGVALRQAGISLPIIVMNPEESSFHLMMDYQLEPEIYSFTQLEKFVELLTSNEITNYPVHIKLDSGMHRLGFMANDIDKLCEQLQNKQLRIKSIFSHLAASDEPHHDEFTQQQIADFKLMSNNIVSSLKYPVMRHILNSLGIERFPEAQFEMVRLGIGLYGVNPFNQTQLRNVSTLKSSISQIKTIEPGQTIGYSRKARVVDHDKVIAIIPIGYADGYLRRLGNGAGQMWVNGKLAPTVGNICMDMCMLDITGIDAREGDEVEVFGSNISFLEVSEKMETIPYEVLTGISGRVKRVYVQE